jgi:hypothetical protein
MGCSTTLFGQVSVLVTVGPWWEYTYACKYEMVKEVFSLLLGLRLRGCLGRYEIRWTQHR